ncbi:MAG: ATP-binding protein [Candidatus Aureabacteria bacterium]|nr:ATP-binding protein [Candidatus Auribacterota bacterium]
MPGGNGAMFIKWLYEEAGYEGCIILFSGNDFETVRQTLVTENVAVRHWANIAYQVKPAPTTQHITRLIETFITNQFSASSILYNENVQPIPLITEQERHEIEQEILRISSELKETLDRIFWNLYGWRPRNYTYEDYQFVNAILALAEKYLNQMDFIDLDPSDSLAVRVHRYKGSLGLLHQELTTRLPEMLKEKQHTLTPRVRNGMASRISKVQGFSKLLWEYFNKIDYYLRQLERFERENKEAKERNAANVLISMTFHAFEKSIADFMDLELPPEIRFPGVQKPDELTLRGNALPRGLNAVIKIFLNNAIAETIKANVHDQRKDREIRLTILLNPENHHLEFRVIDEAGGISDPSVIPTLFQGKTMGKGKYGTGYGLVQARRIAETLNGYVSAQNTGSGAEFMISFPFKWKRIGPAHPQNPKITETRA